jgi:hypothetical protein
VKRIAALLFLAVLAGGCIPKSSALPHPLDGQTRYLCCNLHYEQPTVADVNYQVGALVPVGTRVTVTKVTNKAVTFQPSGGGPPITVVLKYGRKNVDMDTFANRLLVAKDPTPALARAGSKVRKQIESGMVEPGMTREQVLMALGYPPAHRTPQLNSPQWTYWQNRWVSFIVWFDGDKVSRVQR